MAALGDADAFDALGRAYRLDRLETALSIPQLRWRQRVPGYDDGQPRPVSVREAISRLESYQPVCALTQRALAMHRGDGKRRNSSIRIGIAATLVSDSHYSIKQVSVSGRCRT